jgi:hypothetical protein
MIKMTKIFIEDSAANLTNVLKYELESLQKSKNIKIVDIKYQMHIGDDDNPNRHQAFIIYEEQ